MKYSTTINNHRAAVALFGKISYEGRTEFQKMIEELMGKDVDQVHVDLSQVEYVDSAGLGMILLLKEKLGGAKVVLEHAQGQVEKIVKLTKIEDNL